MPPITEEQRKPCDAFSSEFQQKEERKLASSTSHEDVQKPILQPTDGANKTSTSSSRDPSSTENRLRPAADVINRIIWDSNFDSEQYLIGYEDRFNGRLEASLGSWKRDLTDEEFIPQHRIIYIKRETDGEIVWDKRRRIDKVFLSGNSAFSWLSFLT